jgi:hypothetical protein
MKLEIPRDKDEVNKWEIHENDFILFVMNQQSES